MKKSRTQSAGGLLTLLFVSALFVTSSSACQKNEFEAKDKEFDRFIEKAFALDMTPGLAVSVVKGNDVIYARGFGYADIEKPSVRSRLKPCFILPPRPNPLPRLLSHSFTGFFSYVSFRPQHDLGVVVLVNGGFMGAMLATTVTKYLYDRLLEKEGLAEKYDKQLAGLQGRSAQFRERLGRGKAQRAARQQTLPNPLAAYTGTYENPELGRMTWQLVNDKLEVSMGLLWSPAEVFNSEENKLRVELTGRGEVVGFSFHAGQADSLTYRKQTFVRVGS